MARDWLWLRHVLCVHHGELREFSREVEAQLIAARSSGMSPDDLMLLFLAKKHVDAAVAKLEQALRVPGEEAPSPTV